MKLWTLQPLSIMEEIQQNGSYRCRKDLSFNLSKRDSLDAQYHWLMERMEQRIGRAPEGVAYPVWAWHTWEGKRQCPEPDSAAFLRRTEDKVLLTLEIPEEDVVLTDFDSWQCVLNGSYLSNETDPEKLDQLEEFIDSLDDDQLEQEIEKSWEHVFEILASPDPDSERGRFVQATFWEIRKEYVINAEPVYRDA